MTSACSRHRGVSTTVRAEGDLITLMLVLMAEAMKNAITASRQAYLAGRMAKKLYASASSPLEGAVR